MIVVAALAAAGWTVTASGTELPSRRAEPIDRVKSCAAYGAGFVYSATTDTCIKVSGSVEVEGATSWRRSGR
jgi:hypothetical protein